MLSFYEQAKQMGAFLRSRIFAVSLLLTVVAGVICYISCQTYAVYIVDENESRSVRYMTDKNRTGILKRVGAEAEKSIVHSVEEPAQAEAAAGSGTTRNAYRSSRQSAVIQIESALVEADAAPQTVQATLEVGDKRKAYTVPSGTTVGELLYSLGVHYDGNDVLTPSEGKIIEDGEEISLSRVELEQFIETEKIPYSTVHKNSPLISNGAVTVAQEGQEGIKVTTYVKYTVDGEHEEVQVLGEQITRHPVDETVLIGGQAPVSTLDFGVEVDENGKPLHYKQVFTNQVATGYSARRGALTASGRQALVGHVAVNPQEIPYGSKLYITSADGRFVYGCAVAADTGTGLLQGVVDVDLFYETYAESAMNGRKIVDIYVLE